MREASVCSSLGGMDIEVTAPAGPEASADEASGDDGKPLSCSQLAEMEELLGDQAPVLKDVAGWISGRVALERSRVETVIQLLDQGASVHFIASYRKEKTGCMSEEELHSIQREMKRSFGLEKRRRRMALALRARGLLSFEVQGELLKAETAEDLDDVWAPFEDPGAASNPANMGPKDLHLLASLLEESGGDPGAACGSMLEAAARILKLHSSAGPSLDRVDVPVDEREVLQPSGAPCTPSRSWPQEGAPWKAETGFPERDQLSTPVKAQKRRRVLTTAETPLTAQLKDASPRARRQADEGEAGAARSQPQPLHAGFSSRRASMLGEQCTALFSSQLGHCAAIEAF